MLTVVIIPIIVLFFSFLLKSASGPYWQFPDPSYGNLIGSLSIIKGLSPTYVSSPGTPLQMLGAVIILLFNIGHSASDTVHRALSDPEFYLNAINVAMIVFVFLASLILGVYVHHRTNDKLTVLLSQLPVLSFLTLRSFSFYDYVLPIVTNVTPEVLMISICCLFNLCLFKLFFAKEPREEMVIVILLGVLCGLGMASKVTFSFFMLIPLIVCKGRLKLLFSALSILSFIFWTIPIISSYVWIWHWLFSLSTHVGEYGSGAKGFINFSQYLVNWHTIWDRCTLLILFALAAVFFNLAQAIKNRGICRETRFFLATVFCILVEFAFIAKHYDEHYLVAVIGLFSPLFVFFYLGVKNKDLRFKAAIFLCIIIFITQSLGHALAYNEKLSGYTRDAVNFSNMIHAKYRDSVFVGVFPMPMATPESAFFEANDWDNNEEDDLSKIYPDNLAYFYNNMNTHAPYNFGIYSIKQRVWADDLLVSGMHVIFVAPKSYDFSQTPYKFLPLEQGKYAGAFLLVGSTEKQADYLFDASLKLLEEGKYKPAFAFALKSRELHYQPVEKVDLFLSIIYQRIKGQ